MKKNYSLKSLILICSSLLFSNLFNSGILKAQCTTPSVQALSSTPANLTCSGNVTVSLASSQAGVAYYLRNDANNNIISGPFFGINAPLDLIGGNISSNTTFNVNAVGVTRALYFDGIDDQAVISNGMSTNGDFTWEAWFKTNDNGSIISIGQPSGNYTLGGKALFIRYSRLSFDCYGIGYMEAPSFLTGVTDNKWHHVAITNKADYNGALDRTSMYMDGQLISIKSDWDITGSQNTGMVNRIGYNTPDFPGSFPAYKGVMDDVKFWNTERTQNQVISDMSACPAGGTAGLEAFYKFEDGTSTALTDNGAGTHPGVLTNMGTPNTATDGREACSTCSVTMTTKPSVTIGTVTAQSVSATTPSFCSSGNTNITTAASELNVNYYMANSTNTVVSGPVAGTGGGLTFATGVINATTTYTVTGKRASGALNFDGVDDIITVDQTPALAQFSTTPMTMEAWVYPTNISTIRSVIRKEGSYNLYLNNGRIYFEMYRNLGGGTNYTITLGQTILPINQWSHIAASWQGGIYADIFLNGNQEIIGGGSSTNNNVGPLSIGRTLVSNQPFQGKIDDIRIWNTARTAAQIKANMRSCLTGSETGLLLNYKFNDSDNSIIDAAGGDNNGTLLNADQATVFTPGVDNCGCTQQMAQAPVVTVYAIPVISANNGTICSGNSAIIVPTGAGTGATYSITGGTFTVTPTTNSTYSVTGTNSAGCVASNTVVSSIVVNTTPTISATSGTICSGQSFNIVPSGANSYNITGGTYNVTPLVTTSYTVTGTSNGCASNAFVTIITVNASPTLAVNSATICSGNSVAIVPTGANTYTITGGSFNVSPNTTTPYSVTGTGANGCAAYNTIVSTISVNTTPTLSVNSSTICSGNVAVISPTGAATYTITGGSFNVSPNTTTSYTVTGTSASGCEAVNPAVSTVSVNTTPTLNVNSATICSGNPVLISPSGANTYTITGGSFNVSPNTTTSYSVTGTAANGCEAANPAVSTVSVNATPTLNVNNPTICSGNAAVISPSGAGTYTITGGSFNVSPNTTTSYSVTGTGTNGCPAASQVVSTVSVNTTPTLAVNSATICSGNSVLISPSGANTYTITGGSFNVSPNTTISYSVTGTAANGCEAVNPAVSTVSVNTTPTLNVNSATICSGNPVLISPSGANTYTITGGSFNVSPNTTISYSVTGTAVNGCEAANPAVSTVSVNATPTLNVNNPTICSGNAAVISPSGAGTYTITGGSFNVSPNTTTSYSVTGTGTNGCPAVSQVVSTVSVNTTPTLAVNSATICSGNSVLISPSGANTYTITGGSFNVSPNTTTSYSVTGTAANGCEAANAAVSTVSVNETPVLSVNNATICSGNSVAIVPTGAGTYTITGGSFTVSPNTTTSYSVTGTGTNACLASNTAVSTISVNTTPTVNVNNVTICSDNSVAIVPTGADTYTITGGNFTVSPTTTTSYSVTGTATNGCESLNSAVSTISVNTTPTLAINSGAICPGNSYTLVPSGAGTYTITGGSFIVSPATMTSYTLTGTGANGCVAGNTVEAVVNVVNTLTVNVTGPANVCSGRAATLTASGASTYTWSTGITTNTIALSPMVNTTYTVYGASGTCSNNAVVTLSVLTTPTLTVNNATICSNNSVAIVPNGAPSYTITGGSFTVSPLTTTSYSVTGTATNNCISNPAVSTISVNTTPTLNVNSATICSGNSLAIVPTGAANYTITGNSFTVTPLSNASYSVTGTGTNGCVGFNTAVSTVSVKATPIVTVNSAAICSGNSVTLVAGGANTYTVTGNNFTVSPTTNTSYSVTGTSTNGCISNNAVSNVTVYALPTITVNSGVICPGNSFTLVPTGAATYTYSNGSDVIVNPTATDSYSVTGTSAQGCLATNTAVATVSVVNTLTITVTGPAVICTGQTATLTANGATTYTWDTGVVSSTIELNPTTNTTYTVSGASGTCSNTAIVNLSVNALPTVAVNSGQVCEGNEFVIIPTGADTYTISGNTFSVIPSANSSYSITGTDVNGCVSAEVVSNVTVNTLPVVTAVSDNTFTCIEATTTLTAGGADTYSWSTGQSDPVIAVSPTETTVYTVTGFDVNGCSASAVVTQSVTECTSIQSHGAASSFVISLYPNPTTGAFVIDLNENAKVIVYNNIGQEIVNETRTAGKQSFVLLNEAHGIYFVKVIVNNKEQTLKLIKE